MDYFPTVTREGYTLEGWYRDDSTFADEVVATDAVIAADTFYANWTEDGV